MAVGLTDGGNYAAIAGAIREVDGDPAKMAPAQMPPRIRALGPRISYSVEYSANAVDATGSTPAQVARAGGSVAAPDCGFSRDGYRFMGWNTEADGSGGDVDPGDAVAVQGDRVLFAKWARLYEVVAYAVCDASPVGEDGSPAKVEVGRGLFLWDDEVWRWTDGLELTRAGYSLAAWYTDKGVHLGYNDSFENTYAKLAGNDPEVTSLALTCDWQQRTYFVEIHDGLGESLAAGKQASWYLTGYAGSTSPDRPVTTATAFLSWDSKPQVAGTRDGYVLEGVYSQPGGQGVRQEATSTVADLCGGVDPYPGPLVVYGNWEELECTLHYDSMGGSEVADATGLRYWSVGLDAAEVPVREGFAFSGWYTSTNQYSRQKVGPGWALSDLRTKQGQSEFTVYAGWDEFRYSITFDGNGGAPETQTASNVTLTSRFYTLGIGSPTRAGHDFVGWFTEHEGGEPATGDDGVLRAAGDVFGYRAGDAAGVSLHAHWADRSLLHARFDPVWGDSPVQTVYNLSAGSAVPSVTAPVRDGYTFLGWFTEPSGGAQVAVDGSATMSGCTPAESGYVTFYAHWEWAGGDDGAYDLLYDAHGGEPAYQKAGDQSYTSTIYMAGIEAPERAGRSFLGWFTKPDGGDRVLTGRGKNLSQFLAGADGHGACFHAHWTDPLKLQLSFEPVLGASAVQWAYDVSPASSDFLDGVADPVRDGHVFAGWYTEPSGGSRVESGHPLSMYTPATMGYVAFYAHWEWDGSTWAQDDDGNDLYDIVYDAQGGEPSCQTATKTATVKRLSYWAENPTRPMHAFAGWYTDPAGGTKASLKQNLKNLGLAEAGPDAFLYAQWKPFAISYGANGGEGEMGPSPGSPASLPDGTPAMTADAAACGFTRDGYRFAGWNTEADGSGAWFRPGDAVVLAGNLELHAVWAVA